MENESGNGEVVHSTTSTAAYNLYCRCGKPATYLGSIESLCQKCWQEALDNEEYEIWLRYYGRASKEGKLSKVSPSSYGQSLKNRKKGT